MRFCRLQSPKIIFIVLCRHALQNVAFLGMAKIDCSVNNLHNGVASDEWAWQMQWHSDVLFCVGRPQPEMYIVYSGK